MSAPREIIPPPGRTPNVERSSGQLASMAVSGGDFLFVSGLTAVDLQSGERIRGTTASETRHILTNLKQLLEAAGSSLDKVVKCSVMIADMAEWPKMNAIYMTYFPGSKPARSAWGANGLALGARVEIECIALAH